MPIDVDVHSKNFISSFAQLFLLLLKLLRFHFSWSLLKSLRMWSCFQMFPLCLRLCVAQMQQEWEQMAVPVSLPLWITKMRIKFFKIFNFLLTLITFKISTNYYKPIFQFQLKVKYRIECRRKKTMKMWTSFKWLTISCRFLICSENKRSFLSPWPSHFRWSQFEMSSTGKLVGSLQIPGRCIKKGAFFEKNLLEQKDII